MTELPSHLRQRGLFKGDPGAHEGLAKEPEGSILAVHVKASAREKPVDQRVERSIVALAELSTLTDKLRFLPLNMRPPLLPFLRVELARPRAGLKCHLSLLIPTSNKQRDLAHAERTGPCFKLACLRGLDPTLKLLERPW